MILGYYVHDDIYICVMCCRQASMDSSVVSDPRNGISGGNLHLRGKGTVFFGKGHQEDANMKLDESGNS